jgi:purine-binding chemotaxis protein CheW
MALLPDQITAHRSAHVVLFRAGSYRGALPITSVQRVLAAVEVVPLPNAPASVRGAINVRGQIVPVLDLRVRLGLPPQDIQPHNRLLLAHTTRRLVALLVDTVEEVVALEGESLELRHDFAGLMPELPAVSGAALLGDELILIYDLETFLSPAEAERLDAALRSLEVLDSDDAAAT